MKYIPASDLPRLNRIAARNKMNRLADDAPVLVKNQNVPIFLALPGIQSAGWVRCEVPTSDDCETHAFIDIRDSAYNRLPEIPSTVGK